MPDETSGQNLTGNADAQSVTNAQLIAAVEQRVVALETKQASRDKDDKADKLLGEVKTGEWWLIGINGLLFIVQMLIALIYIQQLDQMRIATSASTEATRLASASLQYSASEFDRSMAQVTTQTASAYRSADATVKASKAAQAANKIAINNFREDQRPFLFASSINPAGMEEGKPLTVNVDIVNYGRSPATNVTVVGSVFHGPGAIQQSDKYFSGLGTKPLPRKSWGKIVVFAISSAEKEHSRYFSVQSTDRLTKATGDFIIHSDLGVVTAGRIQYTDLFGEVYYSDFCYSHFANGATPLCRRHNDIN